MTRRLAEVAAYAGVSQSTVSRVLNDKPGISPATRTAVLTALDVLGYERPAKLRGERARLVGLVLPELENPLYPAFTEVVAGALAKRGFSPMLCTRTVDTFSEDQYVDLLFAQSASGAVFLGGQYQYGGGAHNPYNRLRSRSMPAVLVNAAAPGLPFPRVSIEDSHAVLLAHGHLATLGHHRIAVMLGPADHVPSARRLAALSSAGPAADLVSRTELSAEAGHAAAARLISRGATALVCADYALTIGAVRAARRLGLAIPRDVSVVGFDDAPALAHTDPPLTTIRQPVEAMGQAAVSMLLHQIEGEPPHADELLFEPDLVVRASTAPPA